MSISVQHDPSLAITPPPRTLLEMWGDCLRLRPLLWVAPLVAGGSALGFQLATELERAAVTHRTPFFAALAALSLGALALALFWRAQQAPFARLAFAAACLCATCGYAAWRVLPPADDVSWLAHAGDARSGPLQARTLTIRGYVADHPQRGEFGLQFPLLCVERDDVKNSRLLTQGSVWVSAPPDAEVEVGDAVQLTGELRPLPRATNPGQREEHWRFVLKRCWSTLRVKESSNIQALRAPPRFRFERLVDSWRRGILTHYESAFQQRKTPYPRANAQLLTAMTFGEGGLRTPLPRLVRDEFRVAGLSHVLVASGTQVAFFGAILLGMGKMLGLRRWWLLALVVPALLVYAAIAGGAPSIMRATVIGVLLAVAVLAGRDTDSMSLWSLALVTLVLFDPAQLMSLSLQLSFAAAWGLIALAPVLQRKFYRLFGKSIFTDLVAFSLAAQFGVLPILLYHFGRVSMAGIGANLLGVPLAGVLVATGIAGLLLPLAGLNESLTRSIADVASLFASLPGAQIETPPVRLAWAVTCYAALCILILSMATGRSHSGAGNSSGGRANDSSIWPAVMLEFGRWWRLQRSRLPRLESVLVVLALAAALYGVLHLVKYQQQNMLLAMLDVGQGESIVVISPEKRVALIDGGGDTQNLRANVGQSVIVPYLQARGVRAIDVLVITHPDADHCNGLLQVLREVPVRLVLDGAQQDDLVAVEYRELKREILRRGIPLVRARAGQQLNLGSSTMRVLGPLPPLWPGDNNNSTVLRLEHGETSVLLTGDIEKEAEERLVRRGADLKCTILKAAHHGSQTSTSPLLLKASQPEAALISCGRYNRFRHPSGEVLKRLQKDGVSVFRTDLDGAIEVLSDGRRCWVQTTR